jgi:pyruvate,orthophosphate dikinase
MTTRLIYGFGGGSAEGSSELKHLLGGKGADLAEMSRLGLPVPPGFTIATTACGDPRAGSGHLWPELRAELRPALKRVEQLIGQVYGDPQRPLLLSVRSGAAVSMPGMMDTVLDLGLNDAVAAGLIARTGNPRFVWDCYRRLIAMFGDVVMGVDDGCFEDALQSLKRRHHVTHDVELDGAALAGLLDEFKAIYQRETREPFPQDPAEQLERAILAVFRSWGSARAVKYRAISQIRGLLGTAVNVQAMVFGNLGATSGTGVCFTRNPSTGARELYGEYLIDAQGEDVVAGVRTPQPIGELARRMPAVHQRLVELTSRLEHHYRDMQDIEFTVQDGELFILQTRAGKRTGLAAVQVAVDLVEEGTLTREGALEHVEPGHIDQLLHPAFADEESCRKAGRVITRGLPASPGAAVGRVVFTARDAEVWKARGERVILVRTETSAEDVAGMHVAEGIVTARGGMTSHAAVVARGWGKPCVAGCAALLVDERGRTFSLAGGSQTTGSLALPERALLVREGDRLSLNGTTGEVILGAEALVPARIQGPLQHILEWADDLRRIQVRANADTPEDATRARELGAQGIGLCRTEHMFFAPDRILVMREMILADDEETRQQAIDRLLPMQREDFLGLFMAMNGLPVTIRLLDPPLHEFLPTEPAQQEEVARDLGVSVERVRARVAALHEENPMLGHRGCRLGITHPEITAMQARAIFEAACQALGAGVQILPEVMVPLVGSVEELVDQKAIIQRVAAEVSAERRCEIPYRVGSMIEVPRAALMAGEIAREAEFFSFGTNDLTQMTLGFSRDDAGSFLPAYLGKGLLPANPFATLDQTGVGQLVDLAVTSGLRARPDLHLGVCGEHGGDPASIEFFCRTGLHYVSCSPFRVPVARFAAARAALKMRSEQARGSRP